MALLNDIIFIDIHAGQLYIEERPEIMFNRIRDWDDGGDHFVIQFRNIEAFSQVDLTTIIPSDIFSGIQDKNDKCYLVIANFLEGFNYIIKEIYRDVIDRYDIPEEKVILFSNALDIQKNLINVAEELKRVPFGLELMNEFEHVANNDINFNESQAGFFAYQPNTLKVKKYDKKFLCFNRRWRFHRPILIALMHIRGLLDYGYISFGPSDDNIDWESAWHMISYATRNDKEFSNLLEKHKKGIFGIPPMYLDKEELITNQALIEFNRDIKGLYANTYFSLVTETQYYKRLANGYHDGCFHSEKTFKPITFKHPFILVATAHTLQYLKSLGYKTFSPFIDERYDTIENDNDRMRAILDETERLCNLSENELEEYLIGCKEIVEYNYNLLKNKTKFTYRVQ